MRDTLLHRLDRWLLSELGLNDFKSQEVKDVWTVLSALRGPDGPTYGEKALPLDSIKTNTTAPIRNALPGIRRLAERNGAFTEDIPFCPNCSKEVEHFNHHSSSAAMLLGVKFQLCKRHQRIFDGVETVSSPEDE